MPFLQSKKQSVVTSFGNTLLSEFAARTKLDQLFQVRVLSFFDPYWQFDLPEWCTPRRVSTMERKRLVLPVKREIVKLWRGLRNYYESNPGLRQHNTVQIS